MTGPRHPDQPDLRPNAGKPEGLPRRQRILRRAHFLRVQGQGHKVHTRHFVILLMASDTLRLGVTVGKRVGKAHDRNRVKRLVREVFRRNKALFPALCDVVLVARPGAERLDYGALKGELERASAALSRAERSLRSQEAEPKERPAR
jgi:ribonuclease P protein component